MILFQLKRFYSNNIRASAKINQKNESKSKNSVEIGNN